MNAELKRKWGIIIFLGLAYSGLTAVPAWAQDKPKKEFRLEGAKIEGEREKPKDLYVAPWQSTTLLQNSALSLDGFDGSEKRIKDRYTFGEEMDYYLKAGVRPQ